MAGHFFLILQTKNIHINTRTRSVFLILVQNPDSSFGITLSIKYACTFTVQNFFENQRKVCSAMLSAVSNL